MSEEGWSGVNDEEELVLTPFDRRVQIEYLKAEEDQIRAREEARKQIWRELGIG